MTLPSSVRCHGKTQPQYPIEFLLPQGRRILQKLENKINDSKTEFIVFSKSTKMKKKLIDQPPIVIDITFNWLPKVTYLGVTLDSKLLFKYHIEKAVNKAKMLMNTLFCLIKRSSTLPINLKILIYKAIIRPVMTYACPTFTNCASSHFNKIQLVQNKCLRMALDSEW